MSTLRDVCILYEDEDVVVARKPIGVPSQPDSSGDPDMTALLSDKTGAEIFAVHRLDRTTGGVTVYAKTKEAAALLSRGILSGDFKKEYLAVVEGELLPPFGEMRDLLFHDKQKNRSFTVKRKRAGVKEAVLLYRTVAFRDGKSLVAVRLLTGRTHQVRVQMASRRHPLSGDGKYGSRDKGTGAALYAVSLAFTAPSGEAMRFRAAPPSDTYPWSLFDADALSTTLDE